MIISKFNTLDLKFYKNKLESICILIHSGEEKNYNNFLMEIKNKTNLNLSKNLDLIILINNLKKFDPAINIKELKINDIFKNTTVINLDLPEELDLYVRFENEKEYLKNENIIPKYGTKSAPNFSFFMSMKLLKNYNTTLLLETDCLLSDDWLEKINNYVENSNGFWVSGAIYDGLLHSEDNIMLSHINGGTALYATGDENFQEFMTSFEEYFLETIKSFPHYAYDWTMKIFIDENIKKNKKDIVYWKFINRNYIANNCIYNFCLQQDKWINEKEINKIYNYAILHKK